MSENQNRGSKDFAKYDSMTTEELETIRKEVDEEMTAAVKFADESPYPDPTEVFEDMYATDNERCVAR